MTIAAVLALPGTTAPSEDRVIWFSNDGCVQWSADGKIAEVFVAGALIGQFTKGDRGARNVVILGLAADPRAHLGRMARAFRVSDEMLRLLRIQHEEEGLRAVLDRAPGGSERKLQGRDLRAAERLFASGASLAEVKEALAKRKVEVSIGTLSGERTRWRARQAKDSKSREASPPAAGAPTKSAEPLAAQQEIELPAQATVFAGEASHSSEPEPSPIPIEMVPVPDPIGMVVEAPEEDEGATQQIPDLPPRSGRFVQGVGAWLLLGMVNALGLYRVLERERARPDREGRRIRSGTVRVATDAFITALALGQKCVEGVRRLQTATAGVLLRAASAPSATWVRRVLGMLAADAGAAHIGLGMAGEHLRAARDATEQGQPTVFYVDNHVRKYTGKEVVRKGWRMQDKRAVPAISDCYVHDEDGRAAFRIDVPAHDSLTSLLGRVTGLLRLALGDEERILVAFDRAGAFPEQMAGLRDRNFEFVTYERRPYALVAKSALTHKLRLEDGEVLRWCEPRQKNLGGGRGRVRRIVVADADGYQINILAVSKAPADWLIQVMRGRWSQENAFKHAIERWGQNQLDARTVVDYPPDTVIPNPARRRLDHALRIARVREGDARRLLARMRPGDASRTKVEKDLADAIAEQEKLEAQRPHLPEHDELQNTELAGKLVYHSAEFKLLIDAIRTACANAECELAGLLAPYMTRPREAKKLLANLFAAPGHVAIDDRAIRVTLLCAANAAERRAIDAFLRALSRHHLTLPGDPAARPLAFRSQESLV